MAYRSGKTSCSNRPANFCQVIVRLPMGPWVGIANTPNFLQASAFQANRQELLPAPDLARIIVNFFWKLIKRYNRSKGGHGPLYINSSRAHPSSAKTLSTATLDDKWEVLTLTRRRLSFGRENRPRNAFSVSGLSNASIKHLSKLKHDSPTWEKYFSMPFIPESTFHDTACGPNESITFLREAG